MNIRDLCVALGLLAGQAAALRPGGLQYPGVAQAILSNTQDGGLSKATSRPKIQAYNMSVPIDHFHNETKYEPHSDGFFNLRYWADVSNYKKGGPVIILHSGEFNTEGRLPFLAHGIVNILTGATGGVGIVLEHRYYGTSWPAQNATTENYRFLTTDQAIADTAYFSRNLEIPGHEALQLNASSAPHILYGGSYAGGLVAFARKLYPNVFWGAISSSGVTAAIDDYWEYHEAARHWAPGECSAVIQQLTAIIDHYLLSGKTRDEIDIKGLFGLGMLYRDEFASYLMQIQPSLQDTNWDPEVDDINLGAFCAIITSPSLLFKSTEHLMEHAASLVKAAGFDSKLMTIRMLNYIAWVKNSVKRDGKNCPERHDLRKCLSVRFAKDKTDIDENSWQRSWLYQTCTEWGYFMGGASTPKDLPAMVSRAVTHKFSSYACESFFGIHSRPNVDIINRHGGFNFSFPRVALIGGRQDPWRSAGPHASGLPDRESTAEEPFEFIDWGVHHWDENGLRKHTDSLMLPPQQVKNVQAKEVDIVKRWLKEYKDEHEHA